MIIDNLVEEKNMKLSDEGKTSKKSVGIILSSMLFIMLAAAMVSAAPGDTLFYDGGETGTPAGNWDFPGDLIYVNGGGDQIHSGSYSLLVGTNQQMNNIPEDRYYTGWFYDDDNIWEDLTFGMGPMGDEIWVGWRHTEVPGFYAYICTGSTWLDSGIARTTGWHQYEMYYGTSGSFLKLDGNTLCSGVSKPSSAGHSFYILGPGAGAWVDDIQLCEGNSCALPPVPQPFPYNTSIDGTATIITDTNVCSPVGDSLYCMAYDWEFYVYNTTTHTLSDTGYNFSVGDVTRLTWSYTCDTYNDEIYCSGQGGTSQLNIFKYSPTNFTIVPLDGGSYDMEFAHEYCNFRPTTDEFWCYGWETNKPYYSLRYFDVSDDTWYDANNESHALYVDYLDSPACDFRNSSEFWCYGGYDSATVLDDIIKYDIPTDTLTVYHSGLATSGAMCRWFNETFICYAGDLGMETGDVANVSFIFDPVTETTTIYEHPFDVPINSLKGCAKFDAYTDYCVGGYLQGFDYDQNIEKITYGSAPSGPSVVSIVDTNGEVTWTTPLDLTSYPNYLDSIIFGVNSLYVDSATVPPLDSEAAITFYNTGYGSLAQFNILKDGSLCTGCSGISLEGGNVSFITDGFSNISLENTTVSDPFILSPNGGELFSVTQSGAISWTESTFDGPDRSPRYWLQYSADNGTTWENITLSTQGGYQLFTKDVGAFQGSWPIAGGDADDLNDDGLVEIMNYNSTGQYVIRSKDSGAWTFSANTFTEEIEEKMNSFGGGYIWCEINNDDKLDLVARGGSNVVYVRYNNGTTTSPDWGGSTSFSFNTSWSGSVRTLLQIFDCDDINGDGYDDLLVKVYDPISGFSALGMVMNKYPSTSFNDNTLQGGFGVFSENYRLFDVDQDGLMDITGLSPSSSARLRVYRNIGTKNTPVISFTPVNDQYPNLPLYSLTWTGSHYLATGDFNDDGVKDLWLWGNLDGSRGVYVFSGNREYTWDLSGLTPGDQYKVRVKSYVNPESAWDESNSTFTIAAAPDAPNVVFPRLGDDFVATETYYKDWTAQTLPVNNLVSIEWENAETDLPVNYTVEVSNGTTWQTLVDNQPSSYFNFSPNRAETSDYVASSSGVSSNSYGNIFHVKPDRDALITSFEIDGGTNIDGLIIYYFSHDVNCGNPAAYPTTYGNYPCSAHKEGSIVTQTKPGYWNSSLNTYVYEFEEPLKVKNGTDYWFFGTPNGGWPSGVFMNSWYLSGATNPWGFNTWNLNQNAIKGRINAITEANNPNFEYIWNVVDEEDLNSYEVRVTAVDTLGASADDTGDAWGINRHPDATTILSPISSAIMTNVSLSWTASQDPDNFMYQIFYNNASGVGTWYPLVNITKGTESYLWNTDGIIDGDKYRMRIVVKEDDTIMFGSSSLSTTTTMNNNFVINPNPPNPPTISYPNGGEDHYVGNSLDITFDIPNGLEAFLPTTYSVYYSDNSGGSYTPLISNGNDTSFGVYVGENKSEELMEQRYNNDCNYIDQSQGKWYFTPTETVKLHSIRHTWDTTGSFYLKKASDNSIVATVIKSVSTGGYTYFNDSNVVVYKGIEYYLEPPLTNPVRPCYQGGDPRTDPNNEWKLYVSNPWYQYKDIRGYYSIYAYRPDGMVYSVDTSGYSLSTTSMVKAEVDDGNFTVGDEGDGVFTIRAALPPVVVSPNGGELYEDEINLSWTPSADDDGNFTYWLEYSTGEFAEEQLLSQSGSITVVDAHNTIYFTPDQDFVLTQMQAYLRSDCTDGGVLQLYDENNTLIEISTLIPGTCSGGGDRTAMFNFSGNPTLYNGLEYHITRVGGGDAYFWAWNQLRTGSEPWGLRGTGLPGFPGTYKAQLDIWGKANYDWQNVTTLTDVNPFTWDISGIPASDTMLWRVSAWDGIGFSDPDESDAAFSINRIHDVTQTVPFAEEYKHSNFTITYAVTDPDDIADVDYCELWTNLNGGGYTLTENKTSPTASNNYGWVVGPSEVSTMTWYVKCVDRFDRSVQTGERTVHIDSANPIVNYYAPLADNSTSLSNSIVRYQINISSINDALNYTAYSVYAPNGTEIYSDISPFDMNVTEYVFDGYLPTRLWPLGEYEIVTNATDLAGNTVHRSITFEITNFAPDAPVLLRPNIDGTYDEVINVTWEPSTDIDLYNPITYSLYLSNDSGYTYPTMVFTGLDATEVVTSHLCPSSGYVMSSGNFFPMENYTLKTISTEVQNTGFYYMVLNQNGSELATSVESYCTGGTNCQFGFYQIDVLPGLNYNWMVYDADSELIASSPTCTGDDGGWLSNGLKTEVVISGSKKPLTYEWNISSLPEGIDYRVRLYATDGALTVYDSSYSDFQVVHCTPNWQVQYTACSVNDTRVKYYTDSESCEKPETIPFDNSTVVSCDYCTPTWSCAAYECQPTDERVCVEVDDGNACYEETHIISDSYTGDYTEFGSEYCDYSYTGPGGGSVGQQESALAQCQDGKDNDLDGFIDYPNDPDCTTYNDNKEFGGCLNDDECGTNEMCYDNDRCVPLGYCEDDSECGPGYECKENACVFEEPQAPTFSIFNLGDIPNVIGNFLSNLLASIATIFKDITAMVTGG